MTEPAQRDSALAEAAERLVPVGRLEPLKLATVPAFAGMFALLGPGVIWASLAQGSGELIWWPYLTAKYGPAFLGLLLPACLLQFWVNLEIARYTIMTGETIYAGFARIHPGLVYAMWGGIAIANLWFGGFASAGGTALASLTHFPVGWAPRGQSLFWGYTMIAIFLCAIFFGKVIYLMIERFMLGVVVVTISGTVLAVLQPEVLSTAGPYFKTFFSFSAYFPESWDASDTNILLTSIAFAGMGGFGNLFYSYWMRDKGVGMSKYVGRITSPITGSEETIPATGYAFSDTTENRRHYLAWLRYVKIDDGLGVGLNIVTVMLMCWLSWSLLMPRGEYPSGWNIAVVQARFFEFAWGPVGRAVFLFVAAAFLCDTWLAVADGYARVHADFFFTNFRAARRWGFRRWYYTFIVILTAMTCTTMLFASPGKLIVTGGTIAFMAMACYCPFLIYLNFWLMPKAFPKWTHPHLLTKVVMHLVAATYMTVAILWLREVCAGRVF